MRDVSEEPSTAAKTLVIDLAKLSERRQSL